MMLNLILVEPRNRGKVLLIMGKDFLLKKQLERNMKGNLSVVITVQWSPFEWVPSQLRRFLTDPTLAKLLEHPGQ